MTKIIGGPAMPVTVATGADSRAVGVAKPVAVVDIGARKILGGSALTVVVITQDEIDEGNYKVAPGPAMPVIISDSIAGGARGSSGPAIPVYVVSGNLYYDPDVPPTGGGSGDDVVNPDEGNPPVVVIGNEVGGSVAGSRRCGDSATWIVADDGGGNLDVQFTFQVQGNAKNAKVKGKGSENDTYTIGAWSGSGWDDITSIFVTTYDNIYSATLPPEYTIGGEVKIKVYKSAGQNSKLYIDCAVVIAEVPPTECTYSFVFTESCNSANVALL